MIIEMKVAIALTTSVTISVRRVLQIELGEHVLAELRRAEQVRPTTARGSGA